MKTTVASAVTSAGLDSSAAMEVVLLLQIIMITVASATINVLQGLHAALDHVGMLKRN